jgi:hypothetical protein
MKDLRGQARVTAFLRNALAEGGMDVKTRDLALLAFLSLLCAIFAWAGD